MKASKNLTVFKLAKTKGKQNIISVGMDMNCYKVLSKGILSFEKKKFVLISGGIKILLTGKEKDILLDTKENRTILRESF